MSTGTTTRLKTLRQATDVANCDHSAGARKVDIHALRRAARMGQVELAIRTGISRPRLSAAENGYLQLSDVELDRVNRVLIREQDRRAAQLREALPGSGEGSSGTDENSCPLPQEIPATPTADFTSVDLAMGLVREWQLRDIPILGYERMVDEVKAAIEREVPGWAPSLVKVAEKIRVVQERYFRWVNARKDDYLIYAHLWFRQRLYRCRGKQWNAYLAAMLKGKQPIVGAERQKQTR